MAGENTILICGLGNPGKDYENTRHNAGFIIVDEIKRNLAPEVQYSNSKDFQSSICDFNLGTFKFILAKPKTFMNNSGLAVKSISDYHKIAPENIVIIHDDLDIILGSYKISFGSQSAGHHGIDSIIEHLGHKDFYRARIGIISPSFLETKALIAEKAKRHAFASAFVLDSFSKSELDIIQNLTPDIIKWIKQHISAPSVVP